MGPVVAGIAFIVAAVMVAAIIFNLTSEDE